MESVQIKRLLNRAFAPITYMVFFAVGWITHIQPDGPLEQAIESLISQAARQGGEALGVHIDLSVDLSASHPSKLEGALHP